MNKELFDAEVKHKANAAISRLKKGREELIAVGEIDQKEIDLLDIVIERVTDRVNPEKPSSIQAMICGPIKEGVMVHYENVSSL